MKKLLTIFAVGATLSASAFLPGDILPVKTPGAVHHPVLSPDGKTLLFSTIDHTGLKAMDMATGDVKVLDENAAAGFAPVFSTDGNTVVYRTAAMHDGLLERDVRSVDLLSGALSSLAPMSREEVNVAQMAGHNVFAVSNYSTITVSDNGVTKEISPLAEANSYLWPSISPDGKRMLFVEPFSGVYVADLSGANPVKVAKRGDFPAWSDDNTIIYVVTKDDGYVTTSAQLFACDLRNGDTRAITPEDIMVEEASAAAGTVVFTTVDGKLYKTTLN